MRARAATVLVLLSLLAVSGVPAAVAAPGAFAAQEGGSEEGVNEIEESQPGGDEGGPESETEPEAETGAGEEQQEGAEQEEGPLWTYQMVWISLGLLLLLGLALGRWYYTLVGRRAR